MPEDLLHIQFWCVMSIIGQTDDRLVKPYCRQPWNLAQIVDERTPADERVRFCQTLMRKNTCCLERFFAKPVVDQLKANDAECIFSPHEIHHKLCMAFRVKVSNMELETNFARSRQMALACRGKTCSIPSMVAKHVTAEAKLAQRRLAAIFSDRSATMDKPDKGRTAFCNMWCLK